MRKWVFEILVIYFLESEKGPDDWNFLHTPMWALSQSWDKQKSSRKFYETEKHCLNFLNFCKDYYNLAENTKFLARSIFSSFAKVGWLMTNNYALES